MWVQYLSTYNHPFNLKNGFKGQNTEVNTNVEEMCIPGFFSIFFNSVFSSTFIVLLLFSAL